MIRVAIETATRVGSVAVGRGDNVLAEVELGEQTRHAARALPALDEALRSAGAGRGEIGAVVVGAGPGSFTGVRVAGATAKGLTTSLGVPLVAYSSLLALAAGVTTGLDPAGGEGVRAGARSPGAGVRTAPAVCGLFDARRGEVYAGCWRVGPETLEPVLEPWVGGVDALVRRLADRPGGGERDPGPALMFAGEGVGRYRDELAAACAAAGLDAGFGAPDARPRASALLWLAEHHPSAGAVEDATAWEPRYVRGSSAERGIRG